MTAEFVVAVHAAVYLAHTGDMRSSDEIAANVCTNPARVRKVLSGLKKAGIVDAKSSFTGGYSFAGDPERVTLYDLFAATCKNFVSVDWRSGDDCAECPISRSMRPIMDGVFDSLEDAGKAVLEQCTVADLLRKIFPEPAGGEAPAESGKSAPLS